MPDDISVDEKTIVDEALRRNQSRDSYHLCEVVLMSRSFLMWGVLGISVILACVFIGIILLFGTGVITIPPSSTPLASIVVTQWEAREATQDGHPIVVAIYRFREDCGLWPERLDDLSPDYLPADRTGGWEYSHYSHDDDWSLRVVAVDKGYAVSFVRTPDSACWNMSDGYLDTPVPSAPKVLVNRKSPEVTVQAKN